MKRYTKLFLCFVVFGVTLPNAQEYDRKPFEVTAENDMPDEHPKRVPTENRTADETKMTGNALGGFLTPKLKIGGYGKLVYRYSDAGDIRHSFAPRFAFVSLNGQLNEQFDYFGLFSFIGEPVFELWLQWKPLDAFSIRIGQQKTPLTFESMISPTVLESINNSRVLSNLCGMAGDVGVNNAGGRDVGVTLYGDLFKQQEHFLLHYALGIFQGTGVNMGDNNNKKDVVASLIVQPLYGLRFGYGIYRGTGHYAVGNHPAADHTRNRQALSADFKTGRLSTRAEWMTGKDGDADKEGVSVLAQWKFIPDEFDAFVRWDYYDNDKKNNVRAVDYTIGCSYYFAKMCRFELNYIFSCFSENRIAGRNSNQALAQIQIVF
ncbi:MAG: OprO/OprP family phosphate-selective porin [Prevotellaceae bacterium]|jgi:hypothetical protein|nr:OprO/OprP family phosphate-selective porin [Prevotellaceae bacterium]